MERRKAIEAHLAEGRFAEARAELAALAEEDRGAGTLAFVGRTLDALADRWPGGLTQTTLYVLRSITLEPLAPRLRAAGLRDGLDLRISFGEFNQFEQEIAGRGALPADAPPEFVVVAARLDELAPPLVRRYIGTSPADRSAAGAEALGRVESLLDQLRNRWPNTTVLLHGFEQPAGGGAFGLAEGRVAAGQRRFIQRLNEEMADLCRARPGVYFVDTDALVAEVGRKRAYDPRMWAHARLPYSTEALDALAVLLGRHVGAVKTPRRKCVVLDCDNTLWGGVIGEDGLEGVALGSEHPGSGFRAFQESLLELHDRGVILALCTKNNEADVLEVLERHPSQAIRREHLAAVRINWQDKAANLRELSRELNIGLDSMVFIDDSSFECELVRQQLPEVLVLQTPADPLQLAELVAGIRAFDALDWSEEDANRGAMYQAQHAREQARQAFDTIEDYLRSLEMHLNLAWTGVAQIARVAQLTRKTNQFNLTTRRYSDQEIQELVTRDDAYVLHAQLGDRFGDHGLTGAVILVREGTALRIDTFLMSCRIIGRGVEDAILAWVLRHAESLGGIDEVVGEYIPTKKNQQTKDFYPGRGFLPAAPGEGSDRWRWPVGARPAPPYPDWIALTTPADGATE
jgi:FkbH-like protein